MREREAPALGGLRVLVAEDDLLISQLVQEVLRNLGCSVVGPVGNLDEALRAIRTHDIDGALLDVRLGSASVYPAASELALRGIPFIVMTGQGSLSGSPALLGDAPLLAKPFKMQQLEDLMKSTFRLCDPGELQHF